MTQEEQTRIEPTECRKCGAELELVLAVGGPFGHQPESMIVCPSCGAAVKATNPERVRFVRRRE